MDNTSNDTPDGYLLYAIAVRALNAHVARGAMVGDEWDKHLARLKDAARADAEAADARHGAMVRSPDDPTLRVAWLRAKAKHRITSSHYREAVAYGADHAYGQRRIELQLLVDYHVQCIK